jgi:hypothetical protein
MLTTLQSTWLHRPNGQLGRYGYLDLGLMPWHQDEWLTFLQMVLSNNRAQLKSEALLSTRALNSFMPGRWESEQSEHELQI